MSLGTTLESLRRAQAMRRLVQREIVPHRLVAPEDRWHELPPQVDEEQVMGPDGKLTPVAGGSA